MPKQYCIILCIVKFKKAFLVKYKKKENCKNMSKEPTISLTTTGTTGLSLLCVKYGFLWRNAQSLYLSHTQRTFFQLPRLTVKPLVSIQKKINNNHIYYFSPGAFIGCKLPSGVALADVSDATELTDDRDDKTSETGATPNDDSISSKSLWSSRTYVKHIN